MYYVSMHYLTNSFFSMSEEKLFSYLKARKIAEK